MEHKDLQEARMNPEFLAYLDHREKEVRESKSISGLYEVLDTLLVLDLDEQRIHKVYEEILKVAFDNIEERLKDEKKLSIENDDIFFIRSFYEHAIEKWSMNNFKGAKELFFILTQIVEDETLVDSISIHLITCAKEMDMDQFYEEKVIHEQPNSEDKYGYFIMNYQFETKEYLEQNGALLNEQYNQLKHLLN
jgi:hypothetical protein